MDSENGVEEVGQMNTKGFGRQVEGLAIGREGPFLPALAEGQVGFVAAVEKLVAGRSIGPFVGDFDSGRSVPGDINNGHRLLRQYAIYLNAWFEFL
jgi:hypothetical protein